MSHFKTSINKVRKNILIALTKNIGAGFSAPKGGFDPNKVKRVLVIRPNHRLGNQLLMTPIVQEIEQTFPNARIDLFAGKIAPVLFRNYDRVDRIVRIPRKPFKELLNYVKAWVSIRNKRYDFVVNVDRSSSSGRLATSFARGKYKIHGEQVESIVERYADYQHIAKYPVYNFRYALSLLGLNRDQEPMPCLNLKLDEKELAEGKTLLNSVLGETNKPVICLYTFATGAKRYTPSWWAEFYDQLKTRYAGFPIMELLPVENVSMIDFKAPSLYSTDVRQMSAILANTAVYIGADCGIMHLASAAPTPTFGFFSVTNPSCYAPYNTGSNAFVTTGLENETVFQALDQLLKVDR